MQKVFIGLGFIILLAIAFLIGMRYLPLKTYYQGPISDHFDGQRFYNPWDAERSHPLVNIWRFLKWRMTAKKPVWPEQLSAEYGSRPPERVKNGLRVTFIGHASFLIQVDGLNIVTDPAWSSYVGPFKFLGVKNHRGPGIRFEDLPPIDWILISHNHYDHMDVPTLEKLVSLKGAKIISGLGNGRLLQEHGIDHTLEMDWWQEKALSDKVMLIMTPAQHWSARWISDRHKALWGSFFIKTSQGGLYFAGDTGFSPHFSDIRERVGPTRLALLPIGAYKPRNIMAKSHMSPFEAIKAHKVLGAALTIPMHFGSFNLSSEDLGQEREDLAQAIKDEALFPEEVKILREGEAFTLNEESIQNNLRKKTED